MGINANFAELYSTVAGHTVSIADINAALAALGTMAGQDANAVAITGGTLNGVVIGGSSPARATFQAPDGSTNAWELKDAGGTTRVSWNPNNYLLAIGGFNLSGASGTMTMVPGADVRADGYADFTITQATLQNNAGGKLLWTGANTLSMQDGTSNQMLSIGAASGTGGGVLVLHQIAAPPTPTAEDVQISFDGTSIFFDKPIKFAPYGGSVPVIADTLPSEWVLVKNSGGSDRLLPLWILPV